MAGPLFLEGERVTLHPVEEADLEFLQETINHPRVRSGLSTFEPLNMAQEREWFESATEDGVQFLVRADGERVGTISVENVSQQLGNGEVGYFYHPDAWGNGYATEALDLTVWHAFDDRRLHKVYANAFASNEGSQRVLEKVGFQREGVHREQGFLDGEYVDVYRYGLLEDEWRENAFGDDD